MLEEYYTTDEVISKLKITRQTLWKLNKTKKLIPKKIGSKNLYKESDIKKLLSENS